MKKIKSKDIQKKEFDILKQFKNYAKENNLKFMLYGGTLLGAIRHKGFIPWDDDIDICMTKSEYNKLLKLTKKNKFIDKNNRFKILCPNDDNYFYPFIKIIDTNTVVYEKSINKKFCIGVWIDIFPLDFWPTNSNEQNKILRKISFYRTMLKFSISGNLPNNKQKILKLIATPFYYLITGKKDYKYWTNKILGLTNQNKTEYIGNLVWALSNKDCFKKEWFDKTLDKEFCGEKFPVPIGWHEYLTRFYGDYMQLPPENERVFHDFDGYVIK